MAEHRKMKWFHRASFQLANVLSYVINPLILPPIAFAIILWHFGAPVAEIVTIAAVAFVFFTLVPLWYLVRMVKAGQTDTIEVRERAARLRPLLFGIGSYVVGVIVILLAGETALSLLVVLALLYPVNTLVIVLITMRWKISVHMVGLAGFISVLLFCAVLVSDALPQPEGNLLRAATVLPLLALIPLLMWARVRVEAHTFGQVVGGTIFGLVMPYAELTIILQVFGMR